MSAEEFQFKFIANSIWQTVLGFFSTRTGFLFLQMFIFKLKFKIWAQER
jgi:hypothetical protein